MTPILIEACAKVGLNVVVTIGIFGLCVWIIKFMVMRMTKVIDKLSDKIDAHEKEASVRSTYIREEHKHMIATLGRINGYKER